MSSDNDNECPESLIPIIDKYYQSFSSKIHEKNSSDTDFLMDLFGITHERKCENSQYWSRELGMFWQLIVTELCRTYKPHSFTPALKIGNTEPCDLFIGNDAIDTKYRIGSGDSGTLKRLKSYGELLTELGHNPVMLIARDGNLPQAIRTCQSGGWTVYTGEKTLEYIEDKLHVRVDKIIEQFGDAYHLNI